SWTGGLEDDIGADRRRPWLRHSPRHGLRSGRTPVVTGTRHRVARKGAGVQILLATAKVPAQQGIPGPAAQAARDHPTVSRPSAWPWLTGTGPHGPSLNSMPDAHDTFDRWAYTRTGRVPQPALWPERSQAATRSGPALQLAGRAALPGSEPAEFAMVRRRSTVRFRKGAPQISRSGSGSWSVRETIKIV